MANAAQDTPYELRHKENGAVVRLTRRYANGDNDVLKIAGLIGTTVEVWKEDRFVGCVSGPLQNKNVKAPRGFAAMSPERRQEASQRGGQNVPAEHRSFAKDRDLATRAGRTGGIASNKLGKPPNG